MAFVSWFLSPTERISNDASEGTQNCVRKRRRTPPHRCDPGNRFIGAVLASTSPIFLVNPIITETLLIRESTSDTGEMPNIVKLTVINRSGLVIEDRLLITVQNCMCQKCSSKIYKNKFTIDWNPTRTVDRDNLNMGIILHIESCTPEGLITRQRYTIRFFRYWSGQKH